MAPSAAPRAALVIGALMVCQHAAALDMYIPSVFSTSGSTTPLKGKKPLHSLLKYTQTEKVSSLVDRIIQDNVQGASDFSVLEVVSTDASIGATLAPKSPDCTWIAVGELNVIGTSQDDAEDDGRDEGWESGQGLPQWIQDEARIPNLISIPTELRHEATDHLFDSPTLFSFVLAVGLDVASLAKHHPKLLGIGKNILVRKGGEKADAFQEQLSAAAASVGVELERVRAWGGKLLEIQLRKFKRPVRHHYSDIRKCPQRGYMFTYKLDEGIAKLERLKYAGQGSTYTARDKDKPVSAWGCSYMNQRTGATLSNGNYVNFLTIAGLGIINSSEQLKRRMIDRFLDMPHFSDGTPWNACVAGREFVWCDRDFEPHKSDKPMRKKALDGVCRDFVDWSEKKTPPCAMDMMLVSTYGCRGFDYQTLRDKWFGGHENSGYHPKDRPVSEPDMLMCRRVTKFGTRPSFGHQERGFRSVEEENEAIKAAGGGGGEGGGDGGGAGMAAEDEAVEEEEEDAGGSDEGPLVYPVRRMLRV